jgi:Na+-transporting methylmalonyl-CoA/oxaloacetate decarboxylase gamma subunit
MEVTTVGQPVTTNPILIALINMTVVFAVLYGLSLVVRLIQVIDPTQKKKREQVEPNSLAKTAIAVAATNVPQEDYDEMVILFTAAIAAYGYSNMRVVSIRPTSGSTWSQAARMEMVSTRNQMI